MTKKLLGVVVVVGFFRLCAFVYALTNNKVVIGYNQGYQPDQPLPFSHQLHAGQYQIDCKYCHTSVAVTRHASIPSLNICMNCHMVVKVDSPWIQKLTAAWSSGKSIAWEKVHLLPDYVRFNHAMHIKAGKDCTTCHGNVAEMTKVYQNASLAMGWCVNCHRQPENHAPTTCTTCHY